MYVTMCLHDGKAQDIEFWLPSYRTALALLSVCMSVNVRARVCFCMRAHAHAQNTPRGANLFK